MRPWLLGGVSLAASLWTQVLVGRHRDELVATGRWRKARTGLAIAWGGCALSLVSAFFWIRA